MTIPDHSHPEVKTDAIKRYTLLQSVISQGFADLLSEVQSGFARTNERIDALEVRIGSVEARLTAIETILNERLGRNGKT